MSCSNSSCRCSNCLKWWQDAGAVPDENGYIGPFSQDEISSGQVRTFRDFFPPSKAFRIYHDDNGNYVVQYKNYDDFPRELTPVEARNLLDYFGATDITRNYESINWDGCETCDYGSEYGHDVRIVHPTKNVHLLRAACRDSEGFFK